MENDLEALEGLALKNYPLAFALFPDELMATQLLIDTVSKYVRVIQSAEDLHDERREIRFLRNLMGLAQLRGSHFQQGKKEEAFYSLDIKKRAILFLREKRGFSLLQISEILETSTDDTYRLLNRAREVIL